MKTFYYNHYRAVNDTNGNPRQFIELFNAEGEFMTAIKYSYNDHPFIVRAFVNKYYEKKNNETVNVVCLSNCIQVTPKCYRERTRNAIEET